MIALTSHSANDITAVAEKLSSESRKTATETIAAWEASATSITKEAEEVGDTSKVERLAAVVKDTIDDSGTLKDPQMDKEVDDVDELFLDSEPTTTAAAPSQGNAG